MLQRPNHPGPPNDSSEFIAKENLLWDPHCKKGALEETSADDITLKFSNITTDTTDKDRDTSKVEQKGTLTFDPWPEREEQDEQHVSLDSDNQVELMHWHYRLGHLSFPKLKILAKIEKIPKLLVNVKPPVCAGCAFGAMTKIPWRGKEKRKASIHGNQAWPMCISGSNDIHSSGFLCPVEREIDQETLSRSHHLCHPLLRIQVCPPADKPSSEETVAAKCAF